MHYKLYIIILCYIVSFLFFLSWFLSVQISTIGRNPIYCLKILTNCRFSSSWILLCGSCGGVLLCCCVLWGWLWLCSISKVCCYLFHHSSTADHACCGAVVWCGQGVLDISPQLSHIHCAVVNPAVVYTTPHHRRATSMVRAVFHHWVVTIIYNYISIIRLIYDEHRVIREPVICPYSAH